MGPRLFVVDSSLAVQRLVEYALTPEGYEVTAFSDGISALDAAKRLRPQVIVADCHLEGLAFGAFCRRMKSPQGVPDASVIALANFSDQLDEEHLRSVGVQAFLKKPLQADHLLQVVKDCSRAELQASSEPAPSFGERGTSYLDETDEAEIDRMLGWAASARPSQQEPELGSRSAAREHEASSLFRDKQAHDPLSPAATALDQRPGALPAGAEEALRGLFSDLVQASLARTEETVTRLLPDLVTKEVNAYLDRAVRTELPAQIAAVLPRDQVLKTVREVAVRLADEAIQRVLEDRVSQHLSRMEPMIQQTLTDITARLVRDLTDKLVRNLAPPTVRKQLPEVLKEQLGPIDELVKEAAEEAAARHTRQAAESVVREMGHEAVRDLARSVIEQAVREVVPDLAEAEIKREIERLTVSDDP